MNLILIHKASTSKLESHKLQLEVAIAEHGDSIYLPMLKKQLEILDNELRRRNELGRSKAAQTRDRRFPR